MLDIKYIRDNIELVKNNCTKRRTKVDIDLLISLDDKRRSLIKQIDDLRADRKKRSASKPSPEEIATLRQMGETIANKETELADTENNFKELLLTVPNLTHPETPVGGEEEYKVMAEYGTLPNFSFSPKDHETIMIERDWVDFERAAKVTGAKFYYFKNEMVRLNQALINYGFDIAEQNGYTPIETPDLAKDEILLGTGYNPRGAETQIYSIEGTDLSLIGTAEITIGGYHAGEILDLSKGPKKYAAISHCYRTEAGSYGRTAKGLYRVHQFTKLELFVFCKPEDSDKYHQELLETEKQILNGLELPYRAIDIASGDLGGPAYRKFDCEAWMVMKGEGDKAGDYGEVTSTSNCTDYQARRLNIRYRLPDGNTEYVHTLNGTAIAFSRIPLAFIENHQQADGSVRIPTALQPYLGGKKSI